MAYHKMTPKGANCKYCPPPDEPIECDDDNAECPNSPDLLMLRDCAADERSAIAFYLRAAHVTCLDKLFLDVAEDEMQHYLETMQMVSKFDPVQAEAFMEVNLPFMLPRRPKKSAKWQPPEPVSEAEDVEVIPPTMEEMETVDILTKALVGELEAINKYQRYMADSENPEVKALFCRLMNEEKEHVAEFTKALFCITHEPLPHEHD